ncbi:MAG: DNA topoisomerase III [Desulfobacula sp.]|nr:DNA topoisomerase III [Desulfobacula sp.]
MTDLILTEKFSVASDFAKALGVKKKEDGFFIGDAYIITWAVGHLVELYAPDDYAENLKKWKIETLPIIPEQFKYKPIKRTYRQFKTIKNLLTEKNFARVIIATDAGREGEVIARTILFESGFLDKNKILRFWTSQALVPDVVRNNMKKLKPATDYDRLWRAGYYRQVSDWMIGMNCTRVLTVRLKDLFSVGRVQTAVLALLTDRKKERDNFIPKTYWTMKVLFVGDKGNWTGHWFKNKDTKLTKKQEEQELYRKLVQEKSPGIVQSVIKERKKELPPFLFSLTDLQQEANNKFGFPAKKTLDIAQRLYQDKKCLSYPRTDSKVLGTQNLDMIKKIIKKLNGSYPEIFNTIDQQRLSLSNKRVFNDAKLTDHHALIVFKPLPAGVTGDQKKVFDLVMRRFAAAFHPDCQFENTKVITLFGKETFQTRGKVILVQGWRKIYIEKTKQKDIVELVPPLVQGDTGIAERIMSDEKQTKPSPDYTDSLLLKDMTNPGRYVSKQTIKKFYRGDIGIGTQSTRAQIIETLISRKYIKRSGKKLMAMDKGCFLVDLLRKCPVSSVLTSPEETARWEMSLNNIALGDGKERKNTKFLINIKKFVTDAVNELKIAKFESRNFETDVQALTIVGNCPACEDQVCEIKKAYGCGNKSCDFVIWKKIAGKNISLKMAANLLKYRKSGPFKGFISKKKKRFSASLKISKDEGAWKVSFDFNDLKKPKAKPEIRKTTGQVEPVCPLCGGKIIEGKKGYGCANWRLDDGNCLFVIWKEISGKKLSLKNIETLLTGKTTRSFVLKDKTGNKFKAKMRMIQKTQTQASIEILPEDNLLSVSVFQVSCTR